MGWRYEPDPRNKHKRRWTGAEAGFVAGDGGEVIGKCPSGMSLEQADALLNDPDAIHVIPHRWNRTYPKMILNVYNGTLYRATWTVPGVSCHGFPEFPGRARELPKHTRMAILALARKRGCEKEIRKCLLGKT